MKKFRWSRVYESSEEELVDFLRAHNVKAKRLTADSGDKTSQQTATKNLCLWCAEGSLTVQAGEVISLQPGDAISIDAGESYLTQPGISGYVCYFS